MAYPDFDLKSAVARFALKEQPMAELFSDVAPREPSARLRDWIAQCGAVALAISTERARSEYLILPILAEVKLQATQPTQVLPGVAFEVDRQQGLTGVCDYLIARSDEAFYVRAPVVAVVEAKREDLVPGLGQCVAEMVAVRLFNEREGAELAAIWGCVTSGNNWRFLKLEGDRLTIDRSEHHLENLSRLVGILLSVVDGTAPPAKT